MEMINERGNKKNFLKKFFSFLGKKWIYLERNTSQTECGPSQKVRKAQKMNF